MDTQQAEVEREVIVSGAYVITRGFQEGKALTVAQKSSSLFSEEPVVLGRVLRRGSRPMRLSGADYRANEHKLLALEKAGAIKIQRPQEVVMPKPCSLCGQVPRGQGGEYKCPSCGLPMVHDPAALNPPGAGDAPASQEPAAPVAAVAAPATPEVIVPPHPPSNEELPKPPVEEPPAPPEQPAPPAEEPAAEPAPRPSAPDMSSDPVSESLPMQVTSGSKKKRSSK